MIQEFRISFLFTRTYLDVFNVKTTTKYPLKENNGILGIFEYMQNNTNNECCLEKYQWKYPWECPWEKSSKKPFAANHFWRYYLQGKDFSVKPSQESAQKLAKKFDKYVAPFLIYKTDYFLTFKSKFFKNPLKVNLQLYAYRHGLGLIINPFIPKGEYNEIEKIIEELRYDKGYTIYDKLTGKPLRECTGEYTSKNLQKTADNLLNFAQKEFELGEYNDLGTKPFSVITILNSGKETNAGNIRKISKKIFIKLDKHFKDTDKDSLSKIDQNSRVEMFTSKRNRIIWGGIGLNVPEPFRIKRKLFMKYYHNNISRLSLQIDSIGDLLGQYMMNEKFDMQHLNKYVDHAQIQLVKLYSRQLNTGNSTYNSKSAIEQINDNYFDSINEVREKRLHISPIIKIDK